MAKYSNTLDGTYRNMDEGFLTRPEMLYYQKFTPGWVAGYLGTGNKEYTVLLVVSRAHQRVCLSRHCGLGVRQC